MLHLKQCKITLLLIFIGPCVIVIVENKKTNLMSLAVLFNFYALNMFRTLIQPSSGANDSSVELPHWSCVLGLKYVGVSVWLGWSGIHVAGFTIIRS